ncbi:hypothetical protein, partial [Escherichia coli]|uniref:hypothetical protein n=1 Tax=Enterobacteriaceae TaxID=543 RepID=UPI001BFCB373
LDEPDSLKRLSKMISDLLPPVDLTELLLEINAHTGFADEFFHGHCCKVSDEAAFCLIQRPYISKTLLTRRISPRGSP